MTSFYDEVKKPHINVSDLMRILEKGKANAKLSDVIADYFLISDRKTQAPLRSVIKEAIEAGHVIGSCPKGYYIIETIEELDEYIGSLESRIAGIQKRIDELKNGWINYIQIDLPL